MISFSVILLIFVNVDCVYSTEPFHQYYKYGKSLVLVGGALSEKNSDIYNEIIELAGGKSNARIGIVTAPSSDPSDSFTYYHKLLLDYGAKEVHHINVNIHSKSANSDPKVVQIIQQQTGFFFTGGDQSRVIESFFNDGHTESPALKAIKHQHDLGAVIAGSSAGTACQPSSVMIKGGLSYDALLYGAHTVSSHANDLIYDPNGGTGLLDGYILDTHFGNRGREGRLIRLLVDTQHHKHGVSFGLGIDENTALIVTKAGTAHATGRVVGESGVTLIDVSQSNKIVGHRDFSVQNVYMSYLTDGDELNLYNQEVAFSATKTRLKGHEAYDSALDTTDIFYGRRQNRNKSEFQRVATSLFDSRLDTHSMSYTYENGPRFSVSMSKIGRDCEGWVQRKTSFQTDLHSYKNMYIEITTDA